MAEFKVIEEIKNEKDIVVDKVVEETKEGSKKYKISEVKAQIASAKGSINSYKTQIYDLEILLANLEAAK